MKRALALLALALAAPVPSAEARVLLRGGHTQGGVYRQRLRNHQNVQYTGALHIGGQPIEGIFDTGSFELLVRSTRCAWCIHPTPPYDRNLSRTYKPNGTMTTHLFGSGPCKSMKGYEKVCVGPLCAQPQSFYEIVSHEMPVLHRASFAAIVGIGPNFAYGNSDSTLLMSFNVSEFSICLQKPSGADGYLTWGSTASYAYREEFYAKARVIGRYHWATRLTNIVAGPGPHSQEDIPCGTSGCVAIVDSGTSLIAAPKEGLVQLSRLIPEVQEDCSNLDDLPDLRFEVDGKTLVLPPRAYVIRITGKVLDLDKIWNILFFRPKYKKVNICLPAFMELDMPSSQGPVWILGMPFLRYYHTTFDRTHKEMFFAQAGPDCVPQPYTGGNATGQLLEVPGRLGLAAGPLDVDAGAILPPTFAAQGALEL